MELLNSLLEIDPSYIILGLLAFFFTLEQVLRTPFNFKNRAKHLVNNLLFQVLLIILNLFFITILVFSIELLNSHRIGLLCFIELPFFTKLVLSVLFYDLTTYWIHRASHKIPLFWRFHRVHHSDTTMDSSTVFRFHPLELILIYQTGNILTALIFGTDGLSMALYYFILYIFFFFEHSNLNYPKWIDNILGLVFVMPNHHRVHHHQDQQYTDSNYADIVILWDRLFGTFKELPIEEMKYGLKEFDTDNKQTFIYLMKSPFIKIEREKNDE
ncbi:Sterol desaturase/sphingolipid hydroxylase, fatty acid hydroxylase superfamily [Aquimarina amphilecti]|uniref:Sterol desaturase/sphingolipid hydroxylase, fatty acid hydroxylase superfamily n=1 Tax=Aquimarina amphilecti TaxID=1038014 RepID=A0A1H7TPY5_AQUAM|nr:sterol desaturase family protein [Aquimarina amphilecti]SEL86930.1 Sterol desaturase/sphingolipid hydroxylase, fatty acid hydroxylase superfamily [Aquimarina amphilecti]